MNLALFISSKVFKKSGGSLSGTVSNIAILSIALGISILIVSDAIFSGFKENLKDKICGFSGHLEVTKFGSGNEYNEIPINMNTKLSTIYNQIDNVDKLAFIAKKPCLLKTDEGISGIMLKGINGSYPNDKISPMLVEGTFLNFSSKDKEVVLGYSLAKKMRIKLNDKILIYFLKDVKNVKIRKLKVVGIYKSDFPEFDDKLVVTKLDLIQNLNKWGDELAGGYEIFINDFDRLEETTQAVYDKMDYNLSIAKITDKFYQIFEWFKVLNFNVKVLMFIIICVALVNVISSFFIIILERTRMIGTLKSMGSGNRVIQKIFFFRGLKILGAGVLIGNVFGLSLAFLQQKFSLMPLDAESYFMDSIPSKLVPLSILNINILFIVSVSIIVFLTTSIISNIKPISSIRFS